MTNKVSKVFILDTDHLSLYGRNHPKIVARIQKAQSPLKTTAINLEEQLRGRLAQVAQAKDDASKSIAYSWLIETVTLRSEFQILQYAPKAQEIYQTLKHLRVGTPRVRSCGSKSCACGTSRPSSSQNRPIVGKQLPTIKDRSSEVTFSSTLFPKSL